MSSAEPQGTGDGAADEAPYHLRLDDVAGLTAYLRQRRWIAADEDVQRLEPAGDGNMNCTLRVVTARQRLVVKQGRPWVEKYPDIPAPPERTLVEAAFYERVASTPAVADRMPHLMGVDRRSRVLAVRDCAGFTDLTAAYEGARIDPHVVESLLAYLVALHRVPLDVPSIPPFANTAMRALNHSHLFVVPLSGDAGLGARLDAITPGLASGARALADDRPYVAAVGALAERYLHGEPRALVHGDFFPGSWLASAGTVVVIDPEFCFGGAPEFDYGVMAAHLMLADQDARLIRQVTDTAASAGADAGAVAGFAGVEIMRRLIGMAQLPRLTRSLEVKLALLAESRRFVLGGPLAA